MCLENLCIKSGKKIVSISSPDNNKLAVSNELNTTKLNKSTYLILINNCFGILFKYTSTNYKAIIPLEQDNVSIRITETGYYIESKNIIKNIQISEISFYKCSFK